MPNVFNRSAALLFMLAAAVVMLYGQFLDSPLIFDDIHFFMLNEQGVAPIALYTFELLQLRSLPYTTLGWTQTYIGTDMLPHRVGNLLLHLAAVWALFSFLTTLISAVIPPLPAGSHKGLSPRIAAFFAALLFALHPVATYATGYLVQRTIVMATLFCLLAIWVYTRGSVRNQQAWMWACVPFYYLAVQSKEHAIMLPVVVVFLTVLLHDDWTVRIRQRWGVFLALAIIAFFVLLARKGLIGSVYEPVAAQMMSAKENEWAYSLSVLTQCGLFFKYALFWLFPNPSWMSMDIRSPIALTIFSPFLVGVVAYLVWGVFAIWLLLKRGMMGLAGFALIYPWVLFATEFSSVRVQEIFVLYRSYLWAVGAFCLLPVVFQKVEAKSAAVMLFIIAAAMFTISMERLVVLSHPMFVWDDAEKLVKDRDDLPGAYRIYYNRGTERAGLGLLEPAIVDYQRAIALNPYFADSYGNLGAALAQQENWDQAQIALDTAIAIARAEGRPYASAEGNLGTVYYQKHEWEKAVAAFTKAMDIHSKEGKSLAPRDVFGRAQAFEKWGKLELAQADYRVSCQLAKRGCDKVKPSQ